MLIVSCIICLKVCCINLTTFCVSEKIFSKALLLYEVKSENSEIHILPNEDAELWKFVNHIVDGDIPISAIAASLLVSKIVSSMTQLNHTLREPGMKNHFVGEEGKKFLDSTSRTNNCVILLDSPECEEWVKFNRKSVEKLPPNQAAREKQSSPVCLHNHCYLLCMASCINGDFSQIFINHL